MENREQLVRKYTQGPQVLAAAVEGLSDAHLDHHPSDGGWSPREVVHHVADSEMTSAIRLRKLIAEEDAVLPGYDQAGPRRTPAAGRGRFPRPPALRSSAERLLARAGSRRAGVDGLDPRAAQRRGV